MKNSSMLIGCLLALASLLAGACGSPSLPAKPLDTDIAGELMPIQDQLHSTFCQSFALTGLLEHIWFHKTHTALKFSEKSVIRAAARTVFETYWNDKERKFDDIPTDFSIGDVGLSALTKAVATYGVAPEDAYPTVKTDDKGNKSFTFDQEAFHKLVYRNSAQLNQAGFTRDDALREIDKLLGDPGAFTAAAKTFSYETYGEQTRELHSTLEMRDFLELRPGSYDPVYSLEGFVPGQEIFNPATHDLYVALEARFHRAPIEAHTAHILDVAEQMLDQGVPLALWIKLQMLKDGVARDIGGHLFILVGYENLPDHTRWYRFKNSGGVHTALIELVPGARFPTRLVNGYIYLEREVLERILMGALVPAAFTPAIENSAS